MPRNNTTFPSGGSRNTTYSSATSMMPRMSYTGPIMPRTQPIDVKPPSFGQTVKEGFSFGIGASVARNVVDRIFGSAQTTPQMTVPKTLGPSKVPLEEQVAYQQCLKDGGDHEKCKDYLI